MAATRPGACLRALGLLVLGLAALSAAQPFADPANSAPFTPWVIDLQQAEAVIAVLDAGPADSGEDRSSETVRVALNREAISFGVIEDGDLVILEPVDGVNAAHVDHILIQTVDGPEDLRLVAGLISTYGGAFVISESWGRDGRYRGGVVAAVDGSLVDRWQPVDQIEHDFHHYLAAANRAMGLGPPGGEELEQGTQPEAAPPRGWVITYAEARELLQAERDSASVSLLFDGVPVEFMPLRDANLMVLTPLDPSNPARIDNILVQLWTGADGEPPAIESIASTYAGTIVIREQYAPAGDFVDGVVERVDGRVVRGWEPPDQYEITLDELLFLAEEVPVLRAGADQPVPPNPLLIGFDANPIDDGATNEGSTGVVSDTGGI